MSTSLTGEGAMSPLDEAPVIISKADAEPDVVLPTPSTSAASGNQAVAPASGPVAPASQGNESSRQEEKDAEVWVGEEAWKEAEAITKNVADIAAKAKHQAADAVSKLGTKFSSWWSALDPSEGIPTATVERSPTTAAKGEAEGGVPAVNLHAVFGIPAQENLLEAFSCKLLQTYRCHHNSLTPELLRAFQGTLYVTDRHTCFLADNRSHNIAVAVENVKVQSVIRQQPRKGEDALKLDLGQGDWLLLKDFETTANLESAFAILEHMCEGNGR